MNKRKVFIGLIITMVLSGCATSMTQEEIDVAAKEQAIVMMAETEEAKQLVDSTTEEPQIEPTISEFQEDLNDLDAVTEMEVDINLNSVEITIPASFYEDNETDPSETIDSMEGEEGIKDVTLNSDGSITLKMTKKKHQELLQQLRNSVDELVKGGTYSSIQEIDYKDDLSYFTVFVNREEFEGSFDTLVFFSLAYAKLYYDVFNGDYSDDYIQDVIIDYQDIETGEVFETLHIPDDLQEDSTSD
jgi:hypothetical protein